jgi:hypothetical protein
MGTEQDGLSKGEAWELDAAASREAYAAHTSRKSALLRNSSETRSMDERTATARDARREDNPAPTAANCRETRRRSYASGLEAFEGSRLTTSGRGREPGEFVREDGVRTTASGLQGDLGRGGNG